MPQMFAIGDELTHVVGDRECPECLEEYPEPCPCGGLIHAAAGETDEGGTDWPTARSVVCSSPTPCVSPMIRPIKTRLSELILVDI
jgi:hypothetical protein